MAKILAIDLGTTDFKFALFDRNGRLCDSCRVATPVRAAKPGWMEVPPGAFVETIAQGIATVCSRVADGWNDVEAVSFATQTNSFLLLDVNNRPLTPIILWPDIRATSLAAEIHERCGLMALAGVTGVPQPNAESALAKLFYLQHQSPKTWEHMNKLCLISDYLTLLFTGQYVTELGAAGLTGIVDIRNCRWWPEMLERLKIDRRCLPTLVRAGTDLGPIAPRAANRFGLPTTCHFIVGCLDQYAGAIGVGNIEPGLLSETTGTVLAAVRYTEGVSQQLDPAVIQGPGFDEGFYWRMTVDNVSANYLQWYRDQLPDRPDFAQLTASAVSIEPGANGLRLRTDANRASPEEVFEGLTSQHTRGHMVRCIMEAVSLALSKQVSLLSDGAPPSEIRCAGGGARSDLWLQIKADLLGISTTATVCPEPTSLGAAMLAEASLAAANVRQIAPYWVHLKPPHCYDARRHLEYQLLFLRTGASQLQISGHSPFTT